MNPLILSCLHCMHILSAKRQSSFGEKASPNAKSVLKIFLISKIFLNLAKTLYEFSLHNRVFYVHIMVAHVLFWVLFRASKKLEGSPKVGQHRSVGHKPVPEVK